MDWIIIGKLFLIIFLIIGNAFFVGSEIALTSARRSRIKQLASTGNKSAKIVQLLHNEPERFYSVTQIGITLVSLALGAIGMVTLTQMWDPAIEAAAVSAFGSGQEIMLPSLRSGAARRSLTGRTLFPTSLLLSSSRSSM